MFVPNPEKNRPFNSAFNGAGTRGKREGGRLIHHSDRGLQYCCREYTGLLTQQRITISMTEKGDPYENAIAERVNGILKGEFCLNRTFKNYEEAHEAVKSAVRIYNEQRPHGSLDYCTPQQAQEKQGALPKRWKPKPRRDDPIGFISHETECAVNKYRPP
ncbi:integrase core domain-containing protein [Flavisolibacter ginsenosidimutans]|uniref:integrase core domain-containing protein n=1 Tax=Flavisolibacter ginsenosidimutans TaxID=661481 RepID=UPI00155AD2E0|nr:integrase core domain-containing protein [Flavisolibacter ginsenosidimutans]